MELNKDTFNFIYELLVDFTIENLDCLTEYEKDTMKHIRCSFRKLYEHILER